MRIPIDFFTQEIAFELEKETMIKSWLAQIIKQHRRIIQTLNFVFVSDAYLLQMNIEHLDHDYYTDILTFAYAENPIESDVYISIDRVKDNAKELHVSFEDELHRVMVHGVLHILGYDDHDEKDIKEMRKQEEMALSLRSELGI